MNPLGTVLSSAVLVGIAIVIGFAGQAAAAFPSDSTRNGGFLHLAGGHYLSTRGSPL